MPNINIKSFNNMIKFKITCCLCLLFSLLSIASGQEPVKTNLSLDNLCPVNRTVTVEKDSTGTPVLHINGRPNAGIAWIKDSSFKNGYIEFDVRGKDLLQQSFVGIAFHGVNDTTYEAVYFRPFNFYATDPIRKKHAVQYIALPTNDWPHLREQFPDKYEAPITSVMDPNDWFHVKLLVVGQTIKIYFNSDTTPVFEVQSLHGKSDGKVGFWTGHTSDGDFKNLTITAKN